MWFIFFVLLLGWIFGGFAKILLGLLLAPVLYGVLKVALGSLPDKICRHGLEEARDVYALEYAAADTKEEAWEAYHRFLTNKEAVTGGWESAGNVMGAASVLAAIASLLSPFLGVFILGAVIVGWLAYKLG